jgi:hypothetical protein
VLNKWAPYQTAPWCKPSFCCAFGARFRNGSPYIKNKRATDNICRLFGTYKLMGPFPNRNRRLTIVYN